jgi:hypothetical protein
LVDGASIYANHVNDTFEAAENEIRATSASNARAIIEDTSGLLIAFCQRILGEAIETDRRLKGNGFPDPSYQSPHAAKVLFRGDIETRKSSMTAFYHPDQTPKAISRSTHRKICREEQGQAPDRWEALLQFWA